MQARKYKIVNQENKTTFYTIFYDGVEYKLCDNVGNLDCHYELVERFRDVANLKSFIAHI